MSGVIKEVTFIPETNEVQVLFAHQDGSIHYSVYGETQKATFLTEVPAEITVPMLQLTGW